MLDGLILSRRGESDARPPDGKTEVSSWSTILSATSRSTAEATGALGHMSYAEVKRYAAVYDYQRHVARTLERLDDQFLLVKSLAKSDLGQLRLEELESLRAGLFPLVQILNSLHDQSATLLQFYDGALKGR